MYNSHNEPFTTINMMSACVCVSPAVFITHVSVNFMKYFYSF